MAFLSLKNAEIRIRIDLQMATISLFEWLTSVQDAERDKQKKTKQKHPTFVSHAAMQRRIFTKLCMKIKAVRTILHDSFQSDQ